jgi:hypothetical protein
MGSRSVARPLRAKDQHFMVLFNALRPADLRQVT